MAKYFKNIKSFSDLKSQFRKLLKENHPDNGGDQEKMKEINAEYDIMFSVWKGREEQATGTTVNETAESTRNEFYTEFGWKGNNYNMNLSIKEIASIVRRFVKEKYPTYKFSIRLERGTWSNSLHVSITESPIPIYKTFDDLTYNDKIELVHRMQRDRIFNLNSWNDTELREIIERVWKQDNGNYYKCMTDTIKSVGEDVDKFVQSYNYSDCDGRIDYFDVNFYYHGCLRCNGIDIKIVPKKERTKKSKTCRKAASSELQIA